MKVCDVVLNSVWYDPRVRKQIVEYKAQGVDVSVVGMKCVRYDEEKVKAIPCPATIVKIDEKYDGKQSGVLRKLRREKMRINAVKNAIIEYRPDVIHANDLNALIPAYLASKKLKCKLIYDSHEVYIENFTTGGRSHMAGFMKRLEKFLIHHSDLMVCVSYAAKEYFAETYKTDNIMVVTNCSLQKEMVELPAEKNNGFEVLNHGAFYDGRGYDVMIRAAGLVKEYPDIKMALRGFGRIEGELHKLAEDLHAENVIFYPKVNVEELIPMASHSMVGLAITEPICLNFKLSVSNKLFEYASAGLPVIMSNIPEHRYLNEKYKFGIVLSDNFPEALAEAVKKLYTDKEFYQMCQENAIKFSKEVYWENEFSLLIKKEMSIFRM